MRRALAVALLAAGPLLASCGEDPEGAAAAPVDASTEDFCAAWDRLALAETGADLRAFSEALVRTGTPAEVTRRERAGFVVVAEQTAAVAPDQRVDDLSGLELPDEEIRDAEAFLGYAGETCGPPESRPSPSPSGSPSEG